jgi:hypothetical protein
MIYLMFYLCRWTIRQALECAWFVDRSSRRAGLRKSGDLRSPAPLKPSSHTRRPRSSGGGGCEGGGSAEAQDREGGLVWGEREEDRKGEEGEEAEGRGKAAGSGRKRREKPGGKQEEEAEERKKSGRKSGKQAEAETQSSQTGSDDQGAKAGTRRNARSARGASPAPATAASKKAKH